MKTTLQASAISSIDFTPEKRRVDIEWINPKSWLGGLITRDGVYRWREDGIELMLGEDRKLRCDNFMRDVYELAFIEIHMTSGLVYYKRFMDSTLALDKYNHLKFYLSTDSNIILEDYDCTRN